MARLNPLTVQTQDQWDGRIDQTFSERDSMFARTRLVAANLTGAQNYRIDILNNDIKRARFSLPEAVALLDSLDIELQD